MVQNFRLVPHKPKSGLIQVAANIWTIEAKECVCYRPPMQPRYPYTHRSVVIRLDKERVTNFLNSAFDWLIPQPFMVEGMMAVARFLTLLLVILPIHALVVFTADLVYPRLIKQDGSI